MTSHDRPALNAIAPTTIRIPPDLREDLQREANLNGRTLSAEIVERLRNSLKGRQISVVEALNTGESALAFSTGPAPVAELHRNNTHRLLITLFDALPPEKQLALLTVLKR